MDHQDEHHLHHEEEREHKKEERKQHEHEQERGPRTIRPAWFLALGAVLITAVVLFWTFL